MSLLEGIIGNPIILVAAAIGVVGVGVIIYLNKSAANPFVGSGENNKKTVDILRPIDHSGFPLKIIDETEKGLIGPKIRDVYWRLYKGGPGWNFPKGTRQFYAMEGDAYTEVFVDDAPRKVRLPDAMRILWGDVAYEKMPFALKDILEKHQFAVTIEPQPVPKKDKDIVVTMEDHDKENIKAGMEELRKNMKNKHKLDWMTLLQGAAIGVVLGIMLVSFKVIKLA
jgi:hypothetical protein